MQWYNRRFELVKIEPDINGIKEYIDTVRKAVKEIERREKALKAFLEGKNLGRENINDYIRKNERIHYIDDY